MSEVWPASTERGEPAAFAPGPAYQAGPFPIPPIDEVDGEMWLAAEVIYGEDWPARHNQELWRTGADGIFAWRDQADWVFE